LISSHYYQEGIDELYLEKLSNLSNEDAVELFVHKIPSQ
jgi:hypothetical protein